MTAKVLVGAAIDRLKELPDKSVQCIVTSPPYWGLRKYKGDPGMIGMEPTWQEHLDNLLAVFRECHRVLRDDGTLWLNYGDAYTGAGRGAGGKVAVLKSKGSATDERTPPFFGLPDKNLMMMPARVALALQEDGWWLRSEVVWSKPNPVPETVVDRPKQAHEKIFLLSKKKRYYYDHIAVRTPLAASSIKGLQQANFDNQQGGDKDPKTGNKSARKTVENLARRKRARAQPSSWASSENYGDEDPLYPKRPRKMDELGSRKHTGFHERYYAQDAEEEIAGGANLRNVWEMAVGRYKGAHFATFPPNLVETCLKAGTSSRGCCSQCGAPLKRLVETRFVPQGDVAIEKGEWGHDGQKPVAEESRREGAKRGTNVRIDIGVEPTCKCENVKAVPCIVLDPFAGAGTVGLVADQMGLDSILIEINREYAEMIRQRVAGDIPLLADTVVSME